MNSLLDLPSTTLATLEEDILILMTVVLIGAIRASDLLFDAFVVHARQQLRTNFISKITVPTSQPQFKTIYMVIFFVLDASKEITTF